MTRSLLPPQGVAVVVSLSALSSVCLIDCLSVGIADRGRLGHSITDMLTQFSWTCTGPGRSLP